MIRQSSSGSTCYDADKDLEYTNYILISILMCCGYSDLNPLNHTIDTVADDIKEIFFMDNILTHDAVNSINGNNRDYLLTDYRRFWYNHQLIMAVR